MPLDIRIEKRASEIMARINDQVQPSWDGIGKGKKNGLVKRWRSACTGICNNIVKTDKIPTKIVKEKHFTIHAPNNGRIKHKQATHTVILMVQCLITKQAVVYIPYRNIESFTMAISI